MSQLLTQRQNGLGLVIRGILGTGLALSRGDCRHTVSYLCCLVQEVKISAQKRSSRPSTFAFEIVPDENVRHVSGTLAFRMPNC